MNCILLQVNEKSCRLRMATYRDGVKRKGDKIGMGLRDFGTTSLLCTPSPYVAILNLQDFSFTCLLSFLMP